MSSDDSEGSVSACIRLWKQHASQEAARKIHFRYIARLTRWAKRLLGHAPCRVADEEDVAAEAIQGFFDGIKKGRFPHVDDRHDLTQVLWMLVNRRVIDHLRRYRRDPKRGLSESARDVGSQASSPHSAGFDRATGDEPTSEEVHELVESLRRRLSQLPAERLRQIALGKLEGRTNAEIAARLGCTTRTVEYSVQAIRKAWQSE